MSDVESSYSDPADNTEEPITDQPESLTEEGGLDSEAGPSPSPQAPTSWSKIKPVFDLIPEFFKTLPPFEYVESQYDEILKVAESRGRLIETLRKLCLSDRYFLLTRVLRRKDAQKEMIYKLCRMVEADADGYLDLWSREHYKTSIITFAGTIQEVLKNPEITIAIFSFNKPIAKSFLKQIMREFENNELLKKIFPDILWGKPKNDSKRIGFAWSADQGITVKRKGNQKEATVEAHGLVDGQPTSRHYDLRIYNDVVTRDTVRSETSLHNTRDGWELSLNLASGENARSWYEGTIYHNADVYATIRDRTAAIPRIVPITHDRTETGEPTVYSRAFVKKKRREMGAYNFACQCLLLPQRMGSMSFDLTWLNFYDASDARGMNKVIIVDPAGEKKRNADYTAIGVLGFASDHNTYVLDMYRDKMSLGDRIKLLFELYYKWRPYMVYYEKYGMQSDVEVLRRTMAVKSFHFPVKEVGGNMSKKDRIMRLQPDLENGVWYLPEKLIKVNYQGMAYDVVADFINLEYTEWPFPTHDDCLDMLSRKYDIKVVYPDQMRFNVGVQREEKSLRKWNSMESGGGWRKERGERGERGGRNVYTR